MPPCYEFLSTYEGYGVNERTLDLSYDILVNDIGSVIDGAADEASIIPRLEELPIGLGLPESHPADEAGMVVVIDRRGNFASQNAAAARVLKIPAGSSLSQIADTPEAARTFLATIAETNDPVPVTIAGPGDGTVLMLGVPNETKDRISLHEVRRGFGDQTQRRFAECIGLSASEQRVYFRLMAGRTIAQIAVELDRKEGTVRQQVKAILEKSGVRSQSQLISLSYSLSLAVERNSISRRTGLSAQFGAALQSGIGGEAGYHRLGLAGGLPVLLFHGALFGIAAVPTVRSSAHALGLDIVAPERPGYGNTRLPEGSDPLSMAVDQALQTLDKLDWRRVVLLAHDVGTLFATRFALTHPSRVAAIVAAPATPPMQNWSQTADMPTRHRVNAWAAQKLPVVMDKIVMLALARIARRGVDLIPQLVFSDCAFDQAVLAQPDHAVALEEAFSLVWRQRGAGFRRDMLLTNEDWRADLPRIDAPFIALHGDRSLTVSRRAVEAMAQAAPQGHFRLVEQAGHSLPLSHAPLIFRYVLAAGIRAGLGGAEHGVL